MIRLLLLLSCFFLFTFGCTVPPVIAPDPAHITLPTAIPAQSTVQIPLDPTTPEANPTMTFDVKVFDDATGEPILANVHWVRSDEWRMPLSEEIEGEIIHAINMQFPASATGWIVVASPGYDMWKLQVSFQIKTSRWTDVPVRMKRVGARGGI